jgi:2-polyprenyl-6-methoxyphenol hydroxylase-like FAD-dependent oxidoreductase
VTQEIRTTCCIAGGGPAGMMLGFLLARAGVDVTVLEKHADFLRDFRGDTIHPSTLEVMYELGLLDEFLARPHQKITHLTGQIGNEKVVLADFTHLPVHCPYIALMPQWDFLDFLADQGRKFPHFNLKMQAQVIGLVMENCRVAGVETQTPGGPLRIMADLVVGADGRHSTLRREAGMQVIESGAPIDVLWMRISRRPEDPDQPLGRFDRGRVFVMLYRDDYWQCAYVIAKGGYDTVRAAGLDSFRESVRQAAPFLGNRVEEIQGWDDVKLLTVTVDHLAEWSRPGLLLIGDAAHAMSPIGGVGINLAIQDAVAAANILAIPLLERRLTAHDLLQVQRRRMWPTRMTQRVQVFMQNRVFARILGTARQESAPPPRWLLWLVRLPFISRLPARIVGMGFRPEHVGTEIE